MKTYYSSAPEYEYRHENEKEGKHVKTEKKTSKLFAIPLTFY